MVNDWLIESAYSPGERHIQEGTVCQDRTYSLIDSNFFAIALADGGGSYLHSELGAEFACSLICNKITQDFAKYYDMDTSDITRDLADYIQINLREYANSLGVEFDDLSSTLLAVVHNHSCFIAIHVGDGVIGSSSSEGTIDLLSEPENGESPNMTFMTTSDHLDQHLRVYRGELEKITSFVLLSDGAAHVLYDYKSRTFTNNAMKVVNFARQNKLNTKLLQTFCDDFLVPNCLVFDDCSIALLTKVSIVDEQVISGFIDESGVNLVE